MSGSKNTRDGKCFANVTVLVQDVLHLVIYYLAYEWHINTSLAFADYLKLKIVSNQVQF